MWGFMNLHKKDADTPQGYLTSCTDQYHCTLQGKNQQTVHYSEALSLKLSCIYDKTKKREAGNYSGPQKSAILW